MQDVIEQLRVIMELADNLVARMEDIALRLDEVEDRLNRADRVSAPLGAGCKSAK